MGTCSPEAKSPAFSSCDAAVTAGFWGGLPLLPFLAWAGWDYSGTIDGALGALLAGSVCAAVLMMFAIMVVLWPIALLIRDRPAWWQPRRMMILGAVVATSVALGFTLRMAPRSREDFAVASMILLCFGIMGLSGGRAASRYYRQTHGDGALAQATVPTSSDAG